MDRRRWTLRSRLALQVTVLLLVGFALLGSVTYVVVSRALHASADRALRAAAIQLAGGISLENGRIVVVQAEEQTEGNRLAASDFSYRVIDARGADVYGSGSSVRLQAMTGNLRRALAGEAAYATVRQDGGDTVLRTYARPIRENGRIVGALAAGRSIEDIQEALDLLRLAWLIAAPAIAAVAGLIGYVLARRTLTPIDRITATAAGISARDLSARIALPGGDDEVGRLAATFDSMLDRLEQGVERERRFIGDASHELRTPIAALEAIVSVTRSRPRTVGDYEMALDDVAAELERLQSLVEGLLQLAREESGGGTHARVVDLSQTLRDVAESLSLLAREKGLTMRTEVEDDLRVLGDPDDLVRLFVNLLDNGIKYTDSGTVAISAEHRDRRWVRVRVSDTGVGIAVEERERVFERFHRADATGAPQGTGLGLAIAKHIVDTHGGTITIDAAPGAGSVFEVVLPVAEPPTAVGRS
jgi:signal transduction histidine kinase